MIDDKISYFKNELLDPLLVSEIFPSIFKITAEGTSSASFVSDYLKYAKLKLFLSLEVYSEKEIEVSLDFFKRYTSTHFNNDIQIHTSYYNTLDFVEGKLKTTSKWSACLKSGKFTWSGDYMVGKHTKILEPETTYGTLKTISKKVVPFITRQCVKQIDKYLSLDKVEGFYHKSIPEIIMDSHTEPIHRNNFDLYLSEFVKELNVNIQ